jgi:hypothetical protein
VAVTRSLLVSVVMIAGFASEGDAGQDPFDHRSWALELSATALGEAWNYNESREELTGITSGLTYAIRDGIVLCTGTTVWYVSQRGSDAFVIGLSGGARWAVWRRQGGALSLDLAVGGSRAESPVPPRGTHFNYIFRTGATLTWPMPGGVRAQAGVSWTHMSNNSPRERNRNPDVQALGVHLGALIPF